jgi:hypothetical protein
MPMTSLTGLSMGPESTEVTGVLIVYDCWKQLVITTYPCVAPLRFLQPGRDVPVQCWKYYPGEVQKLSMLFAVLCCP